jgi:hypothetical protein
MEEHATGDLMMMANDDHRMRTKGWDSRITLAFMFTQYQVAWVRSHGDQCINPIVHRKWYDTLGFFIPPGYRWWYCDTALRDIGVKCGRLMFLPDIFCEHLHPTAPDDDTYRRRSSKEDQKADFEYFKATKAQRREWAIQIMEAMV